MSCTNLYLKTVVLNWGILQPDLGYQYVRSVLACASKCTLNCITVSIVPKVALLVCQMSTKKGSCLEKEDAFMKSGSRMYQKRVNICTFLTRSVHSQ
jgi:hypothetical protein